MDEKLVKRCVISLFIGTAMLVWGFSLDLPGLSLRYDILQGSSEDEDNGELFPSSVRHSFLLGVREEFSRDLWNSLKIGYVIKDFLQEQGGGDYNYIKISDNTSWRVTDVVKLGFGIVGKRIFFSQPDRYGFSKDYYLLGAKIETNYRVFSRLIFSSWFKSNTYLNLCEEKSKEEFTFNGGISSKLDDCSVSLRYRGTLRLPLGPSSVTDRNFLNYGSFSVKWKK